VASIGDPSDINRAAPLATSLLPDFATWPRRELHIGGISVLQLAEEFGTPLFVYDEDHLRGRCREARAAFDDGAAYAAKAFFCTAMARLIHEENLCLDVATGGELHVALRGGIEPSRLIMHGNNKSRAEITEALDAGVGRIVIDSFDELELIENLIRTDRRAPATVMIRVTPGVEAHTHEFIQTGKHDSKFGFSISSGAAETALLRSQRSRYLNLIGIHSHIGSQVLRVESFHEALAIINEFTNALDLPELSIGGGLGVAYVAGERAPSITEWSRHLAESAESLGITARLMVEPGRAIVAQSAITVYRVGTIKDLPGIRTYVAVDGGMSDNPRPVLYGSGYEAFLPRATTAYRDLRVTVVGKHCESGDVLVRDAQLPIDTRVGDLLATPVTGAYGISMGSNYNKVTRPAVIFVSQGKCRTVIRRETYADLTRCDL
jgi:diaminopimelate decarboxylase